MAEKVKKKATKQYPLVKGKVARREWLNRATDKYAFVALSGEFWNTSYSGEKIVGRQNISLDADLTIGDCGKTIHLDLSAHHPTRVLREIEDSLDKLGRLESLIADARLFLEQAYEAQCKLLGKSDA